MGSAYTIFGRSVPSHYLAIGTISATALLAVPNPFKKSEPKKVWNASSEEEDKFVSEYLAKHLKE
ncbi:HHR081Wp [Eremothecium sinecaudum]|uniref:HHR081Wp n=1 Tax=Eremothecium sinecaudum TaxID=45286 RepID=A0A0X8HWR6_9SACH|nr:HHR081Wp [Eremothecium sinecaudum]AMD22850.1 HHR081Wp [Eremothecium sinecaudum]